MGAYAIQAAKATEAQLAKLHPSATSAQLWKMVGVTPMLGSMVTESAAWALERKPIVKPAAIAKLRFMKNSKIWTLPI